MDKLMWAAVQALSPGSKMTEDPTSKRLRRELRENWPRMTVEERTAFMEAAERGEVPQWPERLRQEGGTR